MWSLCVHSWSELSAMQPGQQPTLKKCAAKRQRRLRKARKLDKAQAALEPSILAVLNADAATISDVLATRSKCVKRKNVLRDENSLSSQTLCLEPPAKPHVRKKRRCGQSIGLCDRASAQGAQNAMDTTIQNDFNTELAVMWSGGRVLPRAEFQQAAQELMQQVRAAAARCFSPRQVLVRPFGSLVQDTCIASSDVDMSIVFVDGVEPHGRGKSGKLLRCLGREFRRAPCSASLKVVDEILEATVPILRVRSAGSLPIEGDISLGRRQRASCDEVVKSLLEREPRARQCVLLIKSWAQHHAVNKAFHGFPSSFSWVLLAIFYLQRVSLLPCKSRLLREKNSQSIRELLAGFFGFCNSSELRDRWRGVSVARGDFVKLEEPAQVLFLEVPGESSHNAARCLRPEKWALVLQKAKDALLHLTTPPFKGCLRDLLAGSVETKSEKMMPSIAPESADCAIDQHHLVDQK